MKKRGGVNFFMRWFRTHRTFGGRLALFALALQFYLSFAHIHPDDIYGPLGGSLLAAEKVALPSAESLRAIPADAPWYSDDAFCPICETMYLLGTSSVPEAPQVLPVAWISRPVERPPIVAVLVLAPRRALFQSRAPPAA
jgi:hypothetical protein